MGDRLTTDNLVGRTITDVNVDLRDDGPLTDKLDLYVGDRVLRFRTRETDLGAMLHITEADTDHRPPCLHTKVKCIDISTPVDRTRTLVVIPAFIEVCLACCAHRTMVGPIGEKTYEGEWSD